MISDVLKLKPGVLNWLDKVWSVWAIWVVLVWEVVAKVPKWWSYAIDHEQYETISTEFYNLQTPPSPIWWLPLHVPAASIITILCAGAVYYGIQFSHLPNRLGQTFLWSHRLFLLTVLAQLGKLALLPWIAAAPINAFLLGCLTYAYDNDVPRTYLATLSVALALTTIANISPTIMTILRIKTFFL